MPSLLHEALIELFRTRKEMAPEILQNLFHVPVPAYAEVRTEEADLTQIFPTEYQADLVILLDDADKPVFGIVVEVQLGLDPRKWFSWPLYQSALRARFEIPVAILVVTPDATVAEWAQRSVDLGPHGTFSPVVLGPALIPYITDVEEAQNHIELAVLSALSHQEESEGLAVAAAVIRALVDRDDEASRIYYDLVYAALSVAARKELFAMLNGYEYQSDFAKKYVAEGREEGRVDMLLQILGQRGLEPTDAERSEILACRDEARLGRWVERVLRVQSIEELLAD